MIVVCPKCGAENSLPDRLQVGVLYRCGQCRNKLPRVKRRGARAERVRVFRPVKGIASVLTLMLVADLLVGIAFTIYQFAYGSPSELADVGALGYVVSNLSFIMFGAEVVLFFVWVHRANNNLWAFGTKGLRYTPGSAVGWFFVPLFNLFRPFQIMEEIWRAGDPDLMDDSSWRHGAWSPLILWWVVLFWLEMAFVVAGMVYIGTAIYDHIVSFGPEGDLSINTTFFVWSGVFMNIVRAAHYVVMILLVRAISDRQHQKHARMSLLRPGLD